MQQRLLKRANQSLTANVSIRRCSDVTGGLLAATLNAFFLILVRTVGLMLIGPLMF